MAHAIATTALCRMCKASEWEMDTLCRRLLGTSADARWPDQRDDCCDLQRKEAGDAALVRCKDVVRVNEIPVRGDVNLRHNLRVVTNVRGPRTRDGEGAPGEYYSLLGVMQSEATCSIQVSSWMSVRG